MDISQMAYLLLGILVATSTLIILVQYLFLQHWDRHPGHLLQTSEVSRGKSGCACGDFFEKSGRRCYVMDPSILLWMAGYEFEKSFFVEMLAPWLKGTFPKNAHFRNAHCESQRLGQVMSMASYSYDRQDSGVVSSIYSTCKYIPDKLRSCLRSEHHSMGLGLDVIQDKTVCSFQPLDPAFTKNECGSPEHCISRTLPADVLNGKDDSIGKKDFSAGKAHGMPKMLVNFWDWTASDKPEGVHLNRGQNRGHDGAYRDHGEHNHYQDSHKTRIPPGSEEIRTFSEALQYFRTLFRRGIPFVMARFGDGELSVMKRFRYNSETDIGNWADDPEQHVEGHARISELMIDGFLLAKENSADITLQGGMYLGLPFYFCAEGLRDRRMSGGGHQDWLFDFFSTFPDYLRAVSMNRMVFSWQWGNMNYQEAMLLVHEMGNTGRVILVCNEAVEKNRDQLPS